MQFISPKNEEIDITTNAKGRLRENSEKKEYFKQIFEKPWGYEYLAYQNNKIGIWILHVNSDCETSLHCHFKKDTLIYCLDGSFKINLFDSYEILNTFDNLYIPRNTFHGIHSYTNHSVLMEIEIYTDEIDYTDKNDLLRIKDVYNRDKNRYETSVVPKEAKENEIMNFHNSDTYNLNNTEIKIVKIKDNNETIHFDNYDKVILLKGNIFQQNVCGPGSIINPTDNYSLLTNDIELIMMKNIYYPLTNKIIYSNSQLSDMIEVNNYKNIGLTSGCFDIIHTGHLKTLKTAKQNCSHLFVCLSSDEQIKFLKGDKRPINNINDRLHMLMHMDFIDYIILYNEINDENESVLDNIMNTIKPEIWFKGTDYTKENILQKHPTLKNIMLIELEENKSTSNIINKILV